MKICKDKLRKDKRKNLKRRKDFLMTYLHQLEKNRPENLEMREKQICKLIQILLENQLDRNLYSIYQNN